MKKSLFTALFCVLFITSCTLAQENAPPQDTSDTGKIIISFAAPERDRFQYKASIDAFNQQNSDIGVVFVPEESFPQDYTTTSPQSEASFLARVADTAVGVIQPSDITHHFIANLSQYINIDKAFNLNDYYPQSLIPMSDDGDMYVLPTSTYVPLLYYNKNLWSSSSGSLDWATVLEAAKQVTRKTGKIDIYGLMDGEQGIPTFLQAIDAAGVDLLNTSLDQVNFQLPAIVAAAQQTRELVADGVIYSISTSDTTEDVGDSVQDVERLVRSGRMGIWRAEAFSLDLKHSDLRFEVGSILMPQSRQMTAVPFRYGYMMSSGTPHPAAAWRWLSFLSRQPLPGNNGAFNVPARRSLAAESNYWDNYAAQDVRLMQTYLEHPVVKPQAFTDGEARAALLTQWDTIIRNRDSVQHSLAAAQAFFDAQQQQAREQQARATPAPVVVASPEPIAADMQVINVGMPFESRADLRELATIFMQQHPSTQVNVRYPGNADSLPSLTTYAQAYDCFAWPRPPSDHEAAFLLDLTPLIDADQSFAAADYPAALLSPFQLGTKRLGLPMSVQLNALAYNQALFDRFGVPAPQPTWTLDQFLATAQQLTDTHASPPRYGYGMTFAGPLDLRTFLALYGASTTTTNGTEASFTSDEFVAAVRFYADVLKQYSPHQTLPGYREPHSIPDVLSDGQTGMWVTSFANASMNDPASAVLIPKIAPLPRGAKNANANNITITGIYISATTQYPQVCWDWIKFLSARADTANVLDFPARRSVAQSAEFAAQAAPGAADVYAAYQPLLDQPGHTAARDLFADPQFDPYWLFRAVDRVLQGRNAEQELRDAEVLTRRYYACLAQGQRPFRCARSVDPAYAGLAAGLPAQRP